MTETVRIILVEPLGALNVGSIARVMKNMGLSQLVLVKPQCDPLGEEARRMAVHAVDVLENAQRANSLPEALTGIKRAIATTARSRSHTVPLESPKTALPWLLEEPATSALIFGPEDRGLSNTELNYAQRFVRIPSNPDYPSLNLAQSVAICCYELAQLPEPAITDSDLATFEALEGYYQQLEDLLLKIGYLYPHTAATRMEKFRHLVNRAATTSTEVAMLRGVLSQIQWALQNKANGD